jgi:hypothetical protein
LGVWLFADSSGKSYAKCINIQIELGFIYAIIGMAMGGENEEAFMSFFLLHSARPW